MFQENEKYLVLKEPFRTPAMSEPVWLTRSLTLIYNPYSSNLVFVLKKVSITIQIYDTVLELHYYLLHLLSIYYTSGTMLKAVNAWFT